MQTPSKSLRLRTLAQSLAVFAPDGLRQPARIRLPTHEGRFVEKLRDYHVFFAGTNGCAAITHGIIDKTGDGCDMAPKIEGEVFIHAGVDDGRRTKEQHVYPSGDGLTTACTAMLVPAPGRFSMMT